MRLTIVALLSSALSCMTFSLGAEPSAELNKLLTLLKSPDEATRLKAVKEIGNFKHKAELAIPILEKLAKSDPDEDVRSVARNACETIRKSIAKVDSEKNSDSIEIIAKSLKSKIPTDRIQALEKLSNLGEKARPATAAIAETLLDTNATVKEAAASCLEQVDPILYKHLISILYDKYDDYKRASVEALGKLGPRAKGAVPILKLFYASNSNAGPLFVIDLRTLRALVSIVPGDPLVVNEVLRIVSDPKTEVGIQGNRMFAINLMDEIKTQQKKKIEALTPLLSDKQHQIIAMERLAKYGKEVRHLLPQLRKLKLDSNPAVREAAAKAIEKINMDQ